MFHRCHRLVFACATALYLMSPMAQALDLAGARLDDVAQVGGRELRLHGAGVRYKAVFKVYALGLYLANKHDSAEGALAETGARRLSLVMLRDVTADEFGQSFVAGINANTDKEERKKLVSPVLRFGEIFANAGDLKSGDRLLADWVPGTGMVTSLNGKSVGAPINDQGFYTALMRVWLGEHPVDALLKPLLLGRAPG